MENATVNSFIHAILPCHIESSTACITCKTQAEKEEKIRMKDKFFLNHVIKKLLQNVSKTVNSRQKSVTQAKHSEQP